MSNEYYNASGNPTYGAPGTSATARAEFASIAAGFALLPTMTGNADKAVVVNGSGTALTVTTGTLALGGAVSTGGALTTGGDLITSGAYALTLTLTGATNVTLPTTGTLATLAGSETLTNKTLTAPTINAATLSGTLSGAATFSGALTLSGGAAITGTTTNDSAGSGKVGEEIETSATANASSGTAVDVVSRLFAAGDYDMWGILSFTNAGATILTLTGWISTTSAVQPALPNGGAFTQLQVSFNAGAVQVVPVGTRRISLATPTTVYLSTTHSFTGSGPTSVEGFLVARRVR